MTPEENSVSQSTTPVPLTVLAITYNEEDRLPGLLECVADWAEEVFIVDSGSTDRTVDICLDYGVKIVQRRFTSFSDQWNFAANALPIATHWSFKLDPDERLSEELKAEIATALSDGESYEGFYMHRRLWFMGRPLHVTTDGTLRIWRTGKATFGTVKVNEHAVVPGPCERIRTAIEHIDSPHLHHWCRKQNLYTTLEADRIRQGNDLAAEPRLFGNLLERRMYFKRVLESIPFSSLVLWLYFFIVKGAWRDGRRGFVWAGSRVSVMKLIRLKAEEMSEVGPYAGDVMESEERVVDPRIAESALQKRLGPVAPSQRRP